MSQYLGPHPEVANGNAITANKVEDSFDRFVTAVNAVDETNFTEDKVLTYRSVHPGALTQTFDESQLLYGEPAAWVSIGRGGTSSQTTSFSLGPRENLYTVDGCSVRVVINGNGVIQVSSFIQVESVKISNQFSDSAGNLQNLTSLDLDMDFKLKKMKAGETHSGATTLHTVTKRMKLRTDPGSADTDYENTKLLRRGFTVSLSDDVSITDAGANGSAYDFFVTAEPTITAVHANVTATTGGNADLAIQDNKYIDLLFLAHLRSHSRYTTARVFLK